MIEEDTESNKNPEEGYLMCPGEVTQRTTSGHKGRFLEEETFQD